MVWRLHRLCVINASPGCALVTNERELEIACWSKIKNVIASVARQSRSRTGRIYLSDCKAMRLPRRPITHPHAAPRNDMVIKTNHVFCFFFLAAGKSTLFNISL
jgi:hypothetical protein